MSKQVRHFYEFGSFRLDLEQRLLTQGEQLIALAPKIFDTLLFLIERKARIVTKDEMMSMLWPDRYVEEANLTQNIFTLRKLLGKGMGKDQYIETIPKRGYRFSAPVKTLIEEVAPPADESNILVENSNAEAFVVRQQEAITSLAVLPMVNETGSAEVEYLSEGITDSIINRLSRLSNVHVVARSLVFSYRRREVEPQVAGAALGATAVLVSRILLSGDELIIRIELVEVSSGWQIWGERYNRHFSDILTVGDELAMQISEKLLSTLSERERKWLNLRYTQNPEAYRLYLKGRYFWNKQTGEGFTKAIESFEEAIKLDPDYAPAHSALADSYVAYDFYGVLPPWESSPKAKAAALKALSIDETLAEAHNSLACIKMMFERDWLGAEREFRRAIELEPNYARAHSWYSHFLMAMGRIEQSFVESKIAAEIDPLDDQINQYLGWHYIHARQFDRAINQLEKTLQNNPEFFLARVTLGIAYVHRGEFLRGIEEFQTALLFERPSLLLAFLGHAYAFAGQREEATKILEELKELSKQVYIPPYGIGLIYTALGDSLGAFEWFEKAFEVQRAWLHLVKVAPELDRLRADPRFTDLLLRLNLAPDK